MAKTPSHRNPLDYVNVCPFTSLLISYFRRATSDTGIRFSPRLSRKHINTLTVMAAGFNLVPVPCTRLFQRCWKQEGGLQTSSGCLQLDITTCLLTRVNPPTSRYECPAPQWINSLPSTYSIRGTFSSLQLTDAQELSSNNFNSMIKAHK